MPELTEAPDPITTVRAVRDLLARRTDVELAFVRHRRTGTVHVLWPADPDAEPDPPEPAREQVVETDWIGWLRGDLGTLCGYVAREHLGGQWQGDQRVTVFADELLCARCHRALGPHAARAFEHPVPRPSHENQEDGT